MVVPSSSSAIPSQCSAEVLLNLGRPFVQFPRFSIQSILHGRDGDGNHVPFSEWLTRRLQVGQPFIITDFDKLDTWPSFTGGANSPDGSVPTFGIERLIELSTKRNIPIHNCSTGRDLSFTLRKFTDGARQSAAEFQKLYARDLRCPTEWLEQCRKILPTEVQWGGRLDLFQWLPDCARSEVMMAYVGSEGSNSGFHRCFSSTVALNLLVDIEDDQPVVSIGTDFESQSKYDAFISARGISPHLDWVNHEPKELLTADFPLYVCDQKVGDLVVFPPATAHQIWNPSILSTKLVWNILHPLSLEVGIKHVQVHFNRLCHPDLARTNLSLACAMLSLADDEPDAPGATSLPPDLPLLSRLFRQLLHEETIESTPNDPVISLVSLGTSMTATCNFCGTAIWNRHVRCTECTDFDLCLLCYLNGRSCEHPRSYVWAELVTPEQCSKALSRAREILGFQLEEPWVAKDGKTLGTAVNDLMRAKESPTLRLCHLCRIDHPEWKGRRCDKCSAFFCYRGLFRHFDMYPTDIARRGGPWACPKCLESCNCRCCHFNNAYEKSEKPASKKRIKASDPRGKIMGFADNVFDQKRGGKKENASASSPVQIVGKKRPLEPNVPEAYRQGSLRKIELPTPESEPSVSRTTRESSMLIGSSTYMDHTLPVLLPSVRTIVDGSGRVDERNGGPNHEVADDKADRSTDRADEKELTNRATVNHLPPIVPPDQYGRQPSEILAHSSVFTRAGSSHVMATATAMTSMGHSPFSSENRVPEVLTSPLPSVVWSGSIINRTITQLESKIQTLKQYDEEFIMLKLNDSRKVLHNQLYGLEQELQAKKIERGMSLVDRLRREGFESLAEVVGNEVGIGRADNQSIG